MDKCNNKEGNGKELEISIYTYNVRGLRDKNKRTRLFNLFKSNMKGIIFLQETHTVPGDLEIWQREWGNKIFMSYGTSNSKGVAILISKLIDYEITHNDTDNNGRYIALEGTFNEHNLCLVISPSRPQQAFYLSPP